jgi:hypothetical protein
MNTHNRLGKTKDGLPIIARGVAEDNSGIAVDLGDGTYEIRCTYPIDATYDPDTEHEVYIYNQVFPTAKEATDALYDAIGYSKSYGN